MHFLNSYCMSHIRQSDCEAEALQQGARLRCWLFSALHLQDRLLRSGAVLSGRANTAHIRIFSAIKTEGSGIAEDSPEA